MGGVFQKHAWQPPILQSENQEDGRSIHGVADRSGGMPSLALIQASLVREVLNVTHLYDF